MMNNNDEIKIDSQVYGFLAEYAQQDRFSVSMNSMFKTLGSNSMIIPMNIREDDFYYTVSGLRSAKLQGVVIAPEYRHNVLELCDFKSSDVNECGFCDILVVKEAKLYGDIFIGRAVCTFINEKKVASLALYGSGALAKAILLHVKNSSVKKVTLFNDRVESCMELLNTLEGKLEGVEIDIERACSDSKADFSTFDMAINVANAEKLFSEIQSAKIMVDFAKSNSPFSECSSCTYAGYDDILPYLNTEAYNIFEGKK
ncbi:MAG: hypothetical protein U9P71_03200 [Campylobacterota bacterium]|nr:hypothetical protein [Campylobacterota bacterium]